jgi:predicted Kef-type K+ transport protein
MWWRGAIILLVIGLGIAIMVAWGWSAGIVYGFFLALAVFQTVFLVLWGGVAQRGGSWYYERQLRGSRR